MKDSKRSSRRATASDGCRFGRRAAGKTRGALADENTSGQLGAPLGPYGERSPFEKSVRWRRDSKTPETGSSFTPLQDSVGTLTPSSLHYERHHGGIPTIDPAQHRLVIHGMVNRPLSLTVAEIRRLPSVSRTLVLECGGNSGSEWAAKTGPDVQRSYGLVSCSEWTGVPLSLLLTEAGVNPGASWVIAEGADACRMERSIPIAKAMDNILVAYGQNGEALRPAQGYPLRLIIPGLGGKRKCEMASQSEAHRSGLHGAGRNLEVHGPDAGRQGADLHVSNGGQIGHHFSIGRADVAGPNLYELTGLAWSGRGRIERVDITTDGGRSWVKAQLQEPRLPMAFTRFRLPWRFEGREVTIASRAVDESGYVQPTRQALIAVRGTNSAYHFNGIKFWKVQSDGTVTNVEA